MQEQLINFETAKLAKEKGFKIDINAESSFYTKDGKFISKNKSLDEHMYLLLDDNICVCTQSLLQKWLRDEHDLDITIDTKRPYYRAKTRKYYFYVKKVNENVYIGDSMYNTYEEVLEAALRNSLISIK